MTHNPFKDTSQKIQQRQGSFSLGLGRVVAVPPNERHRVAVVPITKTGPTDTQTDPEVMSVTVDGDGDISLPASGDTIVFGRFSDRRSVVLGLLYGQQSTIRSYDPDERHVGNDDNGGTYIHGPFGVVPTRSDDPTDPDDGAVWHNDTADEYRGTEDDTIVSFDTTPV